MSRRGMKTSLKDSIEKRKRSMKREGRRRLTKRMEANERDNFSNRTNRQRRRKGKAKRQESSQAGMMGMSFHLLLQLRSQCEMCSSTRKSIQSLHRKERDGCKTWLFMSSGKESPTLVSFNLNRFPHSFTRGIKA